MEFAYVEVLKIESIVFWTVYKTISMNAFNEQFYSDLQIIIPSQKKAQVT